MLARVATGEGVRVSLRPVGLSGVVTTPTTFIQSFLTIDSRIVAEKRGEPKKIRFGFMGIFLYLYGRKTLRCFFEDCAFLFENSIGKKNTV